MPITFFRRIIFGVLYVMSGICVPLSQLISFLNNWSIQFIQGIFRWVVLQDLQRLFLFLMTIRASLQDHRLHFPQVNVSIQRFMVRLFIRCRTLTITITSTGIQHLFWSMRAHNTSSYTFTDTSISPPCLVSGSHSVSLRFGTLWSVIAVILIQNSELCNSCSSSSWFIHWWVLVVCFSFIVTLAGT